MAAFVLAGLAATHANPPPPAVPGLCTPEPQPCDCPTGYSPDPHRPPIVSVTLPDDICVEWVEDPGNPGKMKIVVEAQVTAADTDRCIDANGSPLTPVGYIQEFQYCWNGFGSGITGSFGSDPWKVELLIDEPDSDDCFEEYTISLQVEEGPCIVYELGLALDSMKVRVWRKKGEMVDVQWRSFIPAPYYHIATVGGPWPLLPQISTYASGDPTPLTGRTIQAARIAVSPHHGFLSPDFVTATPTLGSVTVPLQTNSIAQSYGASSTLAALAPANVLPGICPTNPDMRANPQGLGLAIVCGPTTLPGDDSLRMDFIAGANLAMADYSIEASNPCGPPSWVGLSILSDTRVVFKEIVDCSDNDCCRKAEVYITPIHTAFPSFDLTINGVQLYIHDSCLLGTSALADLGVPVDYSSPTAPDYLGDICL